MSYLVMLQVLSKLGDIEMGLIRSSQSGNRNAMMRLANNAHQHVS